MTREVSPELLDTLPPDDLRAIGSRRDLRRLNRLMFRSQLFNDVLRSRLTQSPSRIVEIGAGDGTLMLELARQNYVAWPNVRVTLVDQQHCVSSRTLEKLTATGWQAEVVEADVFDWLRVSSRVDVILANLVLHHFSSSKLAELFGSLAARTSLFFACETRRDLPSRVATGLLRLIGCNAITRHDARLSVKAGFTGRELSALWPMDDDWRLVEHRTGLFTHLFVAQRNA